MSIRVITFDFWNTIFDSSMGKERNALRRQTITDAIAAVCPELDYDIDKVLQNAQKYFNDAWINSQKTPNSADMVEFIWNYLSLKTDKPVMKKIQIVFEEAVLYIPPQLSVGVKEAILGLEKNYKLAIVSDTGFSPGRILKSLLNTEEILHCFSAFSFSDETGYSKPNSNAYQRIFTEYNLTPETGIHIGDIERTDIVGAKSFGMKAIRYTGDQASTAYNLSNDSTVADFRSDNWGEIIDWIDSNA